MHWQVWLQSLGGGLLIGLAAAMFLLLDGRIAGISGIVGALLPPQGREALTNAAFVLGLLLGPLLFIGLAGHAPAMVLRAPWPLLVIGGLLVGFGTRLGSGCTSGHGVCGLARLSPRSMAAVSVFMAMAIATVFVMRHLLPGIGA